MTYFGGLTEGQLLDAWWEIDEVSYKQYRRRSKRKGRDMLSSLFEDSKRVEFVQADLPEKILQKASSGKWSTRYTRPSKMARKGKR